MQCFAALEETNSFPSTQTPIILPAPPLIVDGLLPTLHRLRPFNNFLGRGSFGNVFSIRDPSDGGQYALKCIRIPNGIRATVVQEVNILMKLLNHENIVQIVGAWPETIEDSSHYSKFVGLDDSRGSSQFFGSSSATYSSENEDLQNKNEETSVPIPPDLYIRHSKRDVMFIKMELSDHSLEKCLTDLNCKSANDKILQVSRIFAQLLSALDCLDHVGIVRNDIRPANILCKSGVIKLADFGLASLQPQNNNNSRIETGETIDPGHNIREIGKLGWFNPYKSPELCLFGPTSVEVGHKSDIYSVGVVILRLLSNLRDWKFLFLDRGMDATIRKIFAKLETEYRNTELDSLTRLLEIVRKMISPSAKDRPSGLYLARFMHPRKNSTCSKNLQILQNVNRSMDIPHLTIVKRKEWGAEGAKAELAPLSLPVENVIIIHSSRGEGYCSTDEQCAGLMREIQALHMNHNKWDDIGYQFAIGGNGRVYEGRGWDKVGAHTLYYNRNSIGFCLMGDFRLHLPPTIQLEATQQLIQFGVQAGYISPSYKLYGHRDVRQGFDSP